MGKFPQLYGPHLTELRESQIVQIIIVLVLMRLWLWWIVHEQYEIPRPL